LSRWQELVDNLLTDLETETPGADDFRVNIDHKIWEAGRFYRFGRLIQCARLYSVVAYKALLTGAERPWETPHHSQSALS
jgi:hypothetical protein